MDYSSYFTAAPQPYQFLGLPPTPTHSGSANSDEFNNSPVRGLPLNLESPMSHHSRYSVPHQPSPSSPHPQQPLHPPRHHPSSSPSSSSPHNFHRHYQHHRSHPFLTQQQDNFDQFQPNFDYSQIHTSANGLPPPKPPTPQSQHASSASSNGNGIGFDTNMDMNDDALKRGSNSDDDDNMTPAQSRRKAQNRAAQRAFRERKERHVKDLEAKLAALEKNSASVVEENERLKLELQKAATENEILRATSGYLHRGDSDPLPNAGPMHYSPTDFYTDVLQAHDNKVPSHRIVTSENGERLLAAGATWDYIIAHPLYVKGMVDVGFVSDRLKEVAKCDGQGPVFEESDIIDAIEKSVASGSDELL